MRRPFSEDPYYVVINDQGFRADFNYSKRNTTNERRILFLGDSFTAGDGVSNSERFSDILCQKLGAKSYNFALSGTGIDQQFIIFKNIASEYDYDLLVISPHIVDINRNAAIKRISFDHQTGEKYWVPKPYFLLEAGKLILKNVPVPKKRERMSIASKSGTNLLNQVFYASKNRMKRLKHFLNTRKHDVFPNEQTWELTEKLIHEMILIAKDKPVLLVPLPFSDIKRNPQYQQQFINLTNKHQNVIFVDILNKFCSYNSQSDLNDREDGHYSKKGHMEIADALFKAISEKEIFKSCYNYPIKKSQIRNVDEDTFVLGISSFYHDSAAALIKNGEIIAAAQEERFTRIKNDASFPYKAINFCLEEARIHAKDLKAVAFYDNPFKTLERILTSQILVYPRGGEIWKEMLPVWITTKLHIPEIIRSELHYNGKIFFIDHHLSHSGSAYFPSPFKESAILTIDGVGEWATATIGKAKQNEIKILQEMDYPNSVGLLYSALTYYTGFRVNDGEYKLMGLAPYGEPSYVNAIKDHLVTIFDDGSIKLNISYFGFMDRMCMINEKFESLFGGPARKSNERITKKHADIAKSIQVITEEIIIKMARHAKKLTDSNNLCLAGGVALNCVANGKLLREKIFKNIWIQPAAGDAGGALGAAFILYHSTYHGKRNIVRNSQKGSFWGPSYSRQEIKAHLDSYDYDYIELEYATKNQTIAQLIADGKIVGHFSGRAEYGPRALGARSILGDPRNEKAQSILNLKIKFRESFRPFAPTVLEEDINKYFDLDCPSPYMLLVANVRKERLKTVEREKGEDLIKIVNQVRSDIPAITHVDNSARIQSINRSLHKEFYDLIREFRNISGYGLLINTSFNVNGEPIVCTPKDAVACFMTTDMDALVIGDFLLLKERQNLEFVEELRFKPYQKNHQVDKTIRQRQLLIKACERLFEIDLKKMVTGRTIQPLIEKRNSTWEKYIGSYLVDDMDTRTSISLNSEEILQRWKYQKLWNKSDVVGILDKIIKLANTFKAIDIDVNADLSDSIYAMF